MSTDTSSTQFFVGCSVPSIWHSVAISWIRHFNVCNFCPHNTCDLALSSECRTNLKPAIVLTNTNMIGKELKYFLLTISVIAHVRLVSSADAQSAAPAQASSLGEDTPAEAAAPAPLIPDVIDTNHLAYTLMAQVFPAQLTDSFAPGPFRENAASTISYKMNVCERSELTDCMRTGAHEQQLTS